MSFSIPTMHGFIGKKKNLDTWNWGNFCSSWNNNNSPILTSEGWVVNGLYMTPPSASLPNSSSLSFNFSDDIKELATYGTSATYSIVGEGLSTCKFDAVSGNISYGMSDIVLDYSILVPTSCNDGVDVAMTINIAGLQSVWWDSHCCNLGYCTWNGTTSLVSYWTSAWGPF